ncbi:MAG TPA: aminotransferase class V-fold PLP-dependent enzyme [Terriglobales bacterium]|nr:aminotransferase class V-fold PLP-dependent enzyme [Terriglobales bacterium]
MNPLEISPARFRRIVDRVADESVSLLENLDRMPSFPEGATGEALQQRFARPLPSDGEGMGAFDDLRDLIEGSRVNSPRFFAYVMGSGEPVAAAADLLASVLNQNVTSWRSGPAAATIERTVVGWLAEAVGCRGFQGSLCGGGSAANLMALAMAREAKLPSNERGAEPAVMYASQEVHMSIGKAVALLGLGRENLRLIAVDDQFRMIPAELEKAVEQDKKAGRKAIAVVATAGTVNTGSIDPLPEIAAIARRHGLWLHVDGAFGMLAAIAAPEKFAGIEQADSLSLDPHKWLYQPVDCGCLLFREAAAAHAAFAHSGDYARSLYQNPLEAFAFFEESLELSRRFRALKLWLSLRYHGLNAFRAAIQDDLRRAQMLAKRIDDEPLLERLGPVPLSAVCFRHKSGGDDLQAAILQRVIARRRVYISNATIQGRFALRACVMNHRSKDEDVLAVVEEVLAAAGEL